MQFGQKNLYRLRFGMTPMGSLKGTPPAAEK